ncbi:carbonic anhydrase [Nitrospira sp. KM1]|uniref:carbonic anhydrase n=1 Tax=Nitrospira sp. KM1 TaxID=1936990 RepID=UPI0013A79987|nr:carbonic anhydrase family protein [Nitrospira sp. KM1]BCA56950.1 carbonic anhydrase [Nitrospira sp. KM1]
MRVGLTVVFGIVCVLVGGPAIAEELAAVEAAVASFGQDIVSSSPVSDGPSKLGDLGSGTAACEKGTHQSPINIKTVHQPKVHDGLLVHYHPAPVHILNSHHTITVDYQSGGTLEVAGRAYDLEEFHFHEPSEHQLNGKTYPMEAHLVHRDQAGHLVVVAVLMEQGPEIPSLAQVWDRIPSSKQDQVRDLFFNAQDLLPRNLHHYAYDGSLTTPPCTEGVHWIVLKEAIYITAAHIQRFVSLIGHNARSIQQLNERDVDEE